jgi:opine dehydrogenase
MAHRLLNHLLTQHLPYTGGSSFMSRKTSWAIVGAGNGGQSLAGHLALMGFPVRLYDIIPETVQIISELGGIKVDGIVEGFGRLAFATTDIARALAGADVIVVVAPAVTHRAIANACSRYLTDNQTVILHPGATCGALEFRKELNDAGCTAKISIAETNTLIYACRSTSPGHASILGIKKELVVATHPAREQGQALGFLRQAFPQTRGGKNVMETSIGNVNAIMHPAPSILNTSLIESRHEWLYYLEGITPTIGAFVEELDKERLALAKTFGIDMPPICEWYRKAYGVDAASLSEATRRNPAYALIPGQKNMRTRYLLEDVPTGLVPMISLGKMQGVDTSRMELVARLAGYLLGEDFFTNGRTLENLGLAGLTAEEFALYLETGEFAAEKRCGWS